MFARLGTAASISIVLSLSLVWGQVSVPAPRSNVDIEKITRSLSSTEPDRCREALNDLTPRNVQGITLAVILAQAGQAALRHRDPWVRVEFMERLCAWPPSELAQHLGSTRLIPHIVENLKHPDWTVRRAAAQLLTQITALIRPVPKELYQAVNDPVAPVRVEALTALRCSGRKYDKIIQIFLNKLSDGDARVRLSALHGLACCYEAIPEQGWQLVGEFYQQAQGLSRLQAALVLVLGGRLDEATERYLEEILRRPLFTVITSPSRLDVLGVRLPSEASIGVQPHSHYTVVEAVYAGLSYAKKVPPGLGYVVRHLALQRNYSLARSAYRVLARADTLDIEMLQHVRKLASEAQGASSDELALVLVRHGDDSDLARVRKILNSRTSSPPSVAIRTFLTNNANNPAILPFCRFLMREESDPDIKVLSAGLCWKWKGDAAARQIALEMIERGALQQLPEQFSDLFFKNEQLDEKALSAVKKMLEAPEPSPLRSAFLQRVVHEALPLPQDCLPGIRRIFLVSHPIERILAAEILVRQENHGPALEYLKNIAQDKVVVTYSHLASSALSRLQNKKTGHGKDNIQERLDDLVAAWKAMSRISWSRYSNYPLLHHQRIVSGVVFLGTWNQRIDLHDPILDKIRQLDPQRAKQLEQDYD